VLDIVSVGLLDGAVVAGRLRILLPVSWVVLGHTAGDG
jgi:hypothetical protein